MAGEQTRSPFERILDASNRIHLDNPFRTSAELRGKHFPGAGGKLSHAKLVSAYLVELADPNPDWQLLAHGTWPWLIGHAHDLITLRSDLERTIESGKKPLDAATRKSYFKRFSENGTAEIELFLRIFANAGSEFQQAVFKRLESQSAQSSPASVEPRPTAPSENPEPVPAPEASRPSVEELDPITRAKMALIGTLFCLFLSLIPLGIQFWRQPELDHWIVVGITGVLALMTIGFAIDYLRKKP